MESKYRGRQTDSMSKKTKTLSFNIKVKTQNFKTVIAYNKNKE